MWLGAATGSRGQDPASAVPRSSGIPCSRQRRQRSGWDVPLRATAEPPHHGPQHSLELLPLLPADHSRGGRQLLPSRLQPLHRGRRSPQSWGTPGPERPPACQPPQVRVWVPDPGWTRVGGWVRRWVSPPPPLATLPRANAGKSGRGSPAIRQLCTSPPSRREFLGPPT